MEGKTKNMINIQADLKKMFTSSVDLSGFMLSTVSIFLLATFLSLLAFTVAMMPGIGSDMNSFVVVKSDNLAENKGLITKEINKHTQEDNSTPENIGFQFSSDAGKVVISDFQGNNLVKNDLPRVDMGKVDGVVMLKDKEAEIKKERKELEKKNKKIKSYNTVVTAYNSDVSQCNGNPCITANGYNLCKYKKEDTVAANHLAFGTKIKIPEYFGDKVFTVRDRMNSRYRNRVDVWMVNYSDARNFGIRRAEIHVLE